MNRRQKTMLAWICGAVVLCCLIIVMLAGIPQPSITVSNAPSAFDAARAYEATAEFVTRFPARVLGSIEARQSTGILRERLEALGYSITYAHFDAVIAGRKQVGRNVYALKPGQSPEIVAMLAHYDTAVKTIQGAMDDGSGVGVLLELARIFATVPTRRSLLFVASDGEEWGMLGAADMAANYQNRAKIVAALSLDCVAAGSLAGFKLDAVGQKSGYSLPWLRQLAARVAVGEGLPVAAPGGLGEQMERAFYFSPADEGPLLHAGIPAINLGSTSVDAGLQRVIYHSPQDTIDKMTVESFGKYGRAAERIVRSLDALDAIPRQSMADWRLHGNAYLPGFVAIILHCLMFSPILLITGFHLSDHRELLIPARIQREILAYAATLFPLTLVYPLIVMTGRLRFLPMYSGYPATLRDPVLSKPHIGVIITILVIFMLACTGCFFLARYLAAKIPRPAFGASKSILLAALSLVCLLALIYNSYWTVTFLLLPTWVWALVGRGRGILPRFLNCLLILAAGACFYWMLALYARELYLGRNIFWYMLLALNCGMFRAEAYFLATAIVALGVRFLAIQFLRAGE